MSIDMAHSVLEFNSQFLSLKHFYSLLAVLYSFQMIIMLQRTFSIGNLLEMIIQITYELYKFALTFGLFLIGAVLIGDSLSTSFMEK